MTVAALPSIISYIEDGATTAFPVPFRFKSASLIVERLLADGSVFTLVPGVDYSVSGGATDAGGTVLRTGATNGGRLRIRRFTARNQAADYATGDRFPAALTEGVADTAMLIDQEQDDRIADTARRALLVPALETIAPLPNAVARAGRIFGFGPVGEPVMLSGTGADAALRFDLAGNGGDLIGVRTAPAHSLASLTDILGRPMPFLEDYRSGLDPANVDHVMDALALASAELNLNGGGGLQFRHRTTYMVGRQSGFGGYYTDGDGVRTQLAYAPDPIVYIWRATKPVIIQGNGARLKAAPGLRYGGFNAAGPLDPYSSYATQAWPYVGMILAVYCTVPVLIENFHLDGSNDTIILGGDNNIDGRQLPASGIFAMNNTAPVIIRNIKSQRHCLDDITIGHAGTLNGTGDMIQLDGIDLLNSKSARQGISLIGGRGVSIRNFRVSQIGRGAFSSSPAAGMDLEPDAGGYLRDVTIENFWSCDNAGPALACDSGNTKGVRIKQATLIGTTAVAAYLGSKGISIEDSLIVGVIGSTCDTMDADDGLRLTRVRLEDDRSLSPTGTVFGSTGGSYLLPLATDRMVTVTDVTIKITYSALPIYSAGYTARFHNLTVDAPSSSAIVRGTFTGTNNINFMTGTAGGIIRYGKFTVGANRFYYSTGIWGSVDVPAGKAVSITLLSLATQTSDTVSASFSGNLGGLIMTAQASSENYVTVTVFNPTAAIINKPSGTVTAASRSLE